MNYDYDENSGYYNYGRLKTNHLYGIFQFQMKINTFIEIYNYFNNDAKLITLPKKVYTRFCSHDPEKSIKQYIFLIVELLDLTSILGKTIPL